MTLDTHRHQHHQRHALAALLRMVLTLIAALMVLSGCNSIKKVAAKVVPFYSYDKTKLSNISLIAELDSNDNMPVAIDFVFIYDIVVDPVISSFSGPQWFANKASIMLQHQQDIDITHVEVVPLTVTEQLQLPEGYDDALKVMMFANYYGKKGQYAVDITLYDELQITLQHSGYQLKELNP